MTGSPVFKFNPNSTRKQKIRKLNIVLRKTKLNDSFVNNVTNITTDNEREKMNKYSLPSTRLPLNENKAKAANSISSSLSSFVFANKKGVKRKLDFDDDESDISFKCSSKNISLAGSKSVRECDSPNKKLFRFSGSYSRSSVSSAVNCRRKLFDREPDSKKSKLESPVLRSKFNSKRNDIKLSLKKKFPGVPNSDSARSGLLLNLAFSKYNLTNENTSNVKVDFVDNDVGNIATKKDFVHYSELKQDHSSFGHSPVFMAVKKVKRKLNLDQDAIANKLSTAKDKNDAENVSQLDCSLNSVLSDTSARKDNNGIEIVRNQLSKSAIATKENNHYTTPNKRTVQQSYKANESLVCSPTLKVNRRRSVTQQRSDLFKNSKLRSSLKDKIFSLSKNLKEITIRSNDTPGSSYMTEKNREHKSNVSSNKRSVFKNLMENLNATKDDGVQKQRNCNRDKFAKVVKTFKTDKNATDALKFAKNRLRMQKPSFSRNTELFLKSHMQRFLKDCLVSVEQVKTIDESSADSDQTISDVDKRQIEEFVIEDESQTQTQDDNFLVPKLCVHTRVNSTLTADKLAILDETTDTQLSKIKEILSVSSCESQLAENDLKVEDISTSESYELQPLEPNHSCRTPETKNIVADEVNTETLETVRKRRKRNLSPNSLSSRLEKLVNREKSEVRIWEYEMLKTAGEMEENDCLKPAVFSIEKMWKEYSHLVLLCSYVKQDVPDKFYELDGIKSFGVTISNLVLLYVEPEYCPKSLTYASTFRVYPPWQILIFEEFEPVIMLQPRKIRIVSKHGKTLRYKDPIMPDEPIVVKNSQFCACGSASCVCVLPDGYQTLIQPLLYTGGDSLSDRSQSRFQVYNADNLDAGCVNEVIVKYKLYSAEHLHLDVRILHVHKNDVCGEFAFWHIVCVDKNSEICCVVVEGEKCRYLKNINNELVFRFYGIVPWKLIPTKNTSSFVEYVQFNNMSDNIQSKIASSNVYVCVLSNKYGYVKRLS